LWDNQGNIYEIVNANEAHPLLIKAVEAEIVNLRFKASAKSSKPAQSWVTVPFQFTFNPDTPSNNNKIIPKGLNAVRDF
jgi:hypothetical protein